MKFKFLKDKEEYLNILKIIDKMFPIPLSAKTSLEVLADKNIECGNVLCCYVDDTLAGVVSFYCNDLENSRAYISVIAVLDEFRGKGISKKLIKKVVDECKQIGMDTIELFTHNTNEIAIKMYETLGFCKVKSEREGDTEFILKI